MSRSKARNYRALALESERQAELAFAEPHFREMQKRLAKSYAALADAEDWLDGIATGQLHTVPDQTDRSTMKAA
jgi:hypothetical protein